MEPELIGQIFGVLTTVCVIVSNQMPKRWQIMIGFMVVNGLATANVLLTNSGLTALMACAVATIHSPINAYRAKKEMESPLVEKIIFSALYFIGWGIGFYLACVGGTASWLDALSFIATGFFVASMLTDLFTTHSNSFRYIEKNDSLESSRTVQQTVGRYGVFSCVIDEGLTIILLSNR